MGSDKQQHLLIFTSMVVHGNMHLTTVESNLSECIPKECSSFASNERPGKALLKHSKHH